MSLGSAEHTGFLFAPVLVAIAGGYSVGEARENSRMRLYRSTGHLAASNGSRRQARSHQKW